MPLPSTRKSKEATGEPWLPAPTVASSLALSAAAALAAVRRGAATWRPAGLRGSWRKEEREGVWRARSKAAEEALRPPVGVMVLLA